MPDIERLKAEFEKIRTETPDHGHWHVIRQDTNGVTYTQCDNVSEDYAQRYTRAFDALIGAHHQTVWCEEKRAPNGPL